MLGKLLENGELELAPKKLHFVKDSREVFIVNPSEEILKEQGYKEIVESEMPTCEENENLEVYYEETETEIKKLYRVVEVEVEVE